jgi:protein-L-isoaspartate(D-aspartate) O-methyltransferase
MAIMLEQLDVRRGHRVLEIGAGTGYNAALLAHIVGAGGRVTAIDIDDDIVAAAREHLDAAGVSHVRVFRGDGWDGDPGGAPYDRIILTVGAADISPAWRAQLAPAGRLVLPLALPAVQASVAFEACDGVLESVSVRACQFMRLRGTAAVPMTRVAAGSAPAPMVYPRGNHAIDGDALGALLRAPAGDVPTGLVVPQRDLYGGVIAWVALHEPRAETSPARPEAAAASSAGTDGGVGIVIRRHGRDETAVRLSATVRAWDAAGRPTLEQLRIRAYPLDHPGQGSHGQHVLTRPCTRLVLDWRA